MGIIGLFVPIAAFLSFTVIVGLLTRLVATGMLNKTLREALKSDPASVPILAERLDARLPWGDALLGWMFLAFALALVVLGVMESDEETRMEMLKAATIPAIVGVTVLLYTRFARRGQTN